MKKITALLICLVTIISGAAYASTFEDAESAEKILIDYFYNHKDEMDSHISDCEIEEAMLADVDNDGIPELLFSRSLYQDGLTVYKVKEGKVEEASHCIWFGRGFAIHEAISLLMDDDGHMHVYRDGVSAYIPKDTEEAVTTINAMYDWSESEFTALAYLEVTRNELTGITEYTNDLSAANNSDFPKTQISSSDAEAKIKEFDNQVKPYIVWSEEDDDKNSGLNRIWNQQKEKYYKNTSTGADKCIVLQVGNPSMNVSGLEKAIDDGIGTAPIVKNGRTLVPVRSIVEEMGGTVEWDAASNTAVLSYSGKTIKLVIDSNIAYLNDVPVTLDVAPIVMNGRTMLPIRFIAESFDFDVDWRESTQQIFVSENSVKNGNKNVSINYELLSCIGKTKEEITKQYGNIVDSEYWNGGKYYIYNNLKSQIFYESNGLNYDSTRHDDVADYAVCHHMWVNLSELLNETKQTEYTVEELQYIFGDYEFTDDLNNLAYPLCYYRFTFGDYTIHFGSEQKNPSVEYVYVFKR